VLWRILRIGLWPSQGRGECSACIRRPAPLRPNMAIMRSFASGTDRDAFYRTALFRDWLARIEPMVEGDSTRRQLDGLEAWFRDVKEPMPPRWLSDLDRGMARQHAHAGHSYAGARAERPSSR
jgi:hypothetical protein